MGPNKITIPKGHFHSKKLNAVSRKIVQMAFTMGGSPGKHFRAVKCNYVFPDGSYCFDNLRSDHNIDCPLCGGNGAYYEQPTDIPIIVSDTTNPLDGDKYGANFQDTVTLTIPVEVDPSIIKVSKGGQVFIVKDKFAVNDHQSRLWAIFIMNSEPQEPYLAGPLYHVVQATSQYTQRQDMTHDAPKIYYNVDERELLAEINKDILTIETGEGIEGVKTLEPSEVVVTNTGIISAADLEDDWS